jgi:hybrid cluster-associated redox disulfide protein
VTRPLFERIGMHCLGCAYATGESVEAACNAHGVEVEPFLQEVNACIAENS